MPVRMEAEHFITSLSVLDLLRESFTEGRRHIIRYVLKCDKTKEEICCAHREVEEWKQNCGPKGRDHLARLSGDGRIILKWL